MPFPSLRNEMYVYQSPSNSQMSSPVHRIVMNEIRHTNRWRTALIFISELIYIRMFLFLSCVRFFACFLIHALVLLGYSISTRAIISPTANSSICKCLKSQLNAPFLCERDFFFLLLLNNSLFPCHTPSFWEPSLIQFELRRGKFVYSFCSAESHLTASCVRYGEMLRNTTSFQMKLMTN